MSMHTLGKRVIPVLLLTALIVVGLVAPGTARAQPPLLKIGYLGAPDSEAANGAQLAVDQINSLGGIVAADGETYMLDLVTLADEPSAETLPAAITALAAQDVVAMIGPDENVLLTDDTIGLLIANGIPVLTGATSDALTTSDTTDTLFRLRAPEEVYTRALATVLVEDRGLTSIALVHTSEEGTSALLRFVTVMDEYGISPAAKVQLSEASRLLEETQTLVDLNPEAIVVWGPYGDAASMLSVLRKRGWQGTFAYRDASQAARHGVLAGDLADGVLGVTSWSFAYPGRASRVFLDDYINAFGEVPGPLSAAAYDAMWYLRSVIQDAGTTPEEIRAGLVAGAPLALVGGELRPAELGDGDLLHIAMVYELGPGGGPTVLAQFSDGLRLPIEDAGN